MAKTLQDFVEEARAEVREVGPEEASQLVESGEYSVLDVREAADHANGHLPGAINVPRGTLEVVADTTHPAKGEALQDRSQKILCYCGGGTRGLLAAKTLKDMGFTDVVSLSGGFRGWKESDLPVEAAATEFDPVS
jgi:rhodanese-related sulfurtransferase